jgi:glycine/D-amino acid oxidase-like deaminating enzyme
MGIVNLNEYRLDFEDNTSTIFMARSATKAVTALERDEKVVVALNRIKTGVGVETPIRNVKFETVVIPEGALINRCRAIPEVWIVPEGTKVIFTAIPSDGYQFDGWFASDGATMLSQDLVAELVVNFPSSSEALTEIIQAHFSPIPAP